MQSEGDVRSTNVLHNEARDRERKGTRGQEAALSMLAGSVLATESTDTCGLGKPRQYEHPSRRHNAQPRVEECCRWRFIGVRASKMLEEETEC